ncbi:uncharacterized protein [Amphiura filiformis]|uniref:uncharacterized protein n=1 Tax=Amphiura filiformis TaxID=82378 RepID=UPI003B21A260
MRTRSRRGRHTSPRIPLDTLKIETQRLLQSSLAPSTWASYRRSLDSFIEFRSQSNLQPVWPVSQYDIVAYISYLSITGWAPASINSHISALAFVHKVNGWKDPTDTFIIKKLKEGCRRLNTRADTRLPITPAILMRLGQVLPSICNSQFEVLLFKAAFVLAFFGFLRVSEFTCPKKCGDFPRVLSAQDIRLVGERRETLEIKIRYSKTDQKGESEKLLIDNCVNMAIQAIMEFYAVRPSQQGPFFIHFGGDPLTFQFNHILRQGIKAIGLSPRDFSSHSFRIGAATTAFLCGIPEERIKEMGRWKSSAVQLYIRPHHFLTL